MGLTIKDRFASILYPPGVSRLEPKVSIALVLILFSAQLTLTTPFAYLPAMVTSFGYQDHERGYYAGVIASSLFVGRFIGGYFWGYLTDKVGRRPVLIGSAALTYFSTLLFGFTLSLHWAVLSRFLQGLCNGVIVCGRAAFAEICDDTNQAIGVSLVFAAWNSAIVLGPAIGGFLADPAKKYPNVFGKGVVGTLFKKFRFLLPNLFITALLLLAMIAVYFFFEETLVTKKKKKEETASEALEDSEEEDESETGRLIKDKKPGKIQPDVLQGSDDEIYSSSAESEKKTLAVLDEHESDLYKTGSDKQPVSEERDTGKKQGCWSRFSNYVANTTLYELISDSTVCVTVGMFGLSGFIIIGFQELTSLWMATGVKLGGLGFTTNQIGTALLVPALCSVVFQPIIFGRVERRLGGIKTLRVFLVILAVMTGAFCFIHEAYKVHWLVWTLLIAMRTIRMVADVCTRSAVAMFVNNSVYPERAGAVNGYAFSVQEIMRSFSPTLMGSIFAWSVKPGRKIFPFDYRLAFFVLTFLISVELFFSIFLPASVNLPKIRLNGKDNGNEKPSDNRVMAGES